MFGTEPSPQAHLWEAEHLISGMRDYAQIGRELFWQRLIIYLAALLLAGYYFSVSMSVITAGLLILAESVDFNAFSHVLASGTDPSAAPGNLRRLQIGAALNVTVICFFVLWISKMEGPGAHFTPLFVLVAASLFAAMNTHQLVSILKIRVAFYSLTFLLIPVWDIWVLKAPLGDSAWLRLFTNIFFLYFLVQCAVTFMRFYRKQIEQIDRLREEHEKVEAALRVKSEFLATMSHELRTPMTSINGAVILARSGKLGALPKQIDSVLAIAETNCRRLSALINDILDLQKIEAGKAVFDIKPLELGYFLRAAIETNSPYGQQFKVDFAPDLPRSEVYVLADRNRLDQVMSNLLSNAAKFSNPGDTVTIRLEADDHTARILVIDTGIGLDESHRDVVFDKFSQVDASDKRRIGGTGLGMNISKRILEAQGARIDYRKNAGPGTTFFVEMKRIQPATEPHREVVGTA